MVIPSELVRILRLSRLSPNLRPLFLVLYTEHCSRASAQAPIPSASSPPRSSQLHNTMTPDPKPTNDCPAFGQLPTKWTPVQRILTQFAIISIILLMMIGQSCSSSIEGPAGFIPDNHACMFFRWESNPRRSWGLPGPPRAPAVSSNPTDRRRGHGRWSARQPSNLHRGGTPPLHACKWEVRAYSTSWAPVHDRCGLHTTPACRVSPGSIHQPGSVNTVPSLQRRRLNLPG